MGQSASQVAQYLWEFGNGKTATTTIPSVNHTYSRPIGPDKTYTVKVTAVGPGDCKATNETEAKIKGMDKPVEPPTRCPEGKIACWVPFIMLIAIIVLCILIEIDIEGTVILGVLNLVWIWACCRCLCRPYLPFLKPSKNVEGCPGGSLACWLPIVITVLTIVFWLLVEAIFISTLAMVIVAGLAILFIILSWRCLCRPHLPFLG